MRCGGLGLLDRLSREPEGTHTRVPYIVRMKPESRD